MDFRKIRIRPYFQRIIIIYGGEFGIDFQMSDSRSHKVVDLPATLKEDQKIDAKTSKKTRRFNPSFGYGAATMTA